MWLKLFSALLVAGFLYWVVRHRLRQRRLRREGVEPVPAGVGPLRPVTVLALLMLGIYGGYMLFWLLSSGHD